MTPRRLEAAFLAFERRYPQWVSALLMTGLGLALLTTPGMMDHSWGWAGLRRVLGDGSRLGLGVACVAFGAARLSALALADGVCSVQNSRVRTALSVLGVLFAGQVALGFLAAGSTPAMGNAGTGIVAWPALLLLEIGNTFAAARENTTEDSAWPKAVRPRP